MNDYKLFSGSYNMGRFISFRCEVGRIAGEPDFLFCDCCAEVVRYCPLALKCSDAGVSGIF